MAHHDPVMTTVLVILLAGVVACRVVSSGDWVGDPVTIRNDVPRRDVNGRIVDAHSGNVLRVGKTYFLYGEHYGNSTGFGESMWPKLVVYTSPDMVAWTFQGFLHNNTSPGWVWPTMPMGTFFTPFAVYNAQTRMVVLWFNAYMNGCCEGGWGVAQSADGLHFDLVTLTETGVYPHVDCNGLFVDDNGTAYVTYSSENPGPGLSDHRVAIERLTPDYLHTTRQQAGSLFTDDFVEGPMLFKRGSKYYMLYGNCCCFCRAGSGVVVLQADNIEGPWTHQPNDINCNVNATICAGQEDPDPIGPGSCTFCPRPLGKINIPAQGVGFSLIPTRNGTAYVWMGERWLSAANNPPDCANECLPPTGACTVPANYIKGEGFVYWIPLEFDAAGNILPFAPFVNSFTLDLL